MAGRALLLAAALPAALAFSDTLPVLAWSSHKSPALDAFASGAGIDVGAVLAHLLAADDICAHDAVVLVDQPGLHAADLRTLAPSALLAQTLAGAPSSLQLPYAASAPSTSIRELAESLAARCGATLDVLAPGDADAIPSDGGKHVVCVELPALPARKRAFASHEPRLSDTLHALGARFPSHLVLLAGSSPASIHARQSDLFGPGPVITESLPPLESAHIATAANTTAATGILARYQLLTAPLLTSLLITFFLVLPAVLAAISALASIQAPRVDVVGGKAFSAEAKKNQ